MTPEERDAPCDQPPGADAPVGDSAQWMIECVEDACELRVSINGDLLVTAAVEPFAGGRCGLSLPDPNAGTLEARLSETWEEIVDKRREEGFWEELSAEEVVPNDRRLIPHTACLSSLSSQISSPVYLTDTHWGSSWMYYQRCLDQDPWPPEAPEPEETCPPEITEEMRRDLRQPPPALTCEESEVEDWVRFGPEAPDEIDIDNPCLPPLSQRQVRGCSIEGGLWPEWVIPDTRYRWKRVITSCATRYRRVETMRVDYDPDELPAALGLLELTQEDGANHESARRRSVRPDGALSFSRHKRARVFVLRAIPVFALIIDQPWRDTLLFLQFSPPKRWTGEFLFFFNLLTIQHSETLCI